MKIILSTLFILNVFFAKAQTLNYAISTSKNQIGHLEVTKKKKGDLLLVSVESAVKVKLFVEVELNYKLNTIFKNGVLIYSSSTTYVNGKIHESSKIEKKEGYYKLTKNGHESRYLDKIYYTGASLYFSEPKNITHVFSEFEIINQTIKKISTNEYELTNPSNNQVNTYSYTNGVLKSAIIPHSMVTFYITREHH